MGTTGHIIFTVVFLILFLGNVFLSARTYKKSARRVRDKVLTTLTILCSLFGLWLVIPDLIHLIK